MSNAIVIINTESTYLSEQCKSLGYDTYVIDAYKANNFDILDDLKKLQQYLNNISDESDNISLIYGSGLENKLDAQNILSSSTNVAGNNFRNFNIASDKHSIKKIIESYNLQIPGTYNTDDNTNRKYLSKPIYSFGGYNIKFDNKCQKNFYIEEYISGTTLSISFFMNKGEFYFLGINKLLLLKNFTPHPFIHAGALMNNKYLPQEKIKYFESLAIDLSLNGYNTIDFKITNDEIYILDINPRITSTFKIYNDMHKNILLKSLINPSDELVLYENNLFYGFVNIFLKEDEIYTGEFNQDSNFICLPRNCEKVKKNQPFLTIYSSSKSHQELIDKLKEKISILSDYYNCYDIDI